MIHPIPSILIPEKIVLKCVLLYYYLVLLALSTLQVAFTGRCTWLPVASLQFAKFARNTNHSTNMKTVQI